MRVRYFVAALLCCLVMPAIAEASELVEGDGYKIRIPSGYASKFDSCESGST